MDALTNAVKDSVTIHGPGILAGVVILIFGLLFARLFSRGLKRLLVAAGVDPTLVGFCCHLFFVVMMALVVVSGLEKMGVPTSSFFAVLGAAGLAVGLALKGTLSNFASGVLLITLRPFSVGDRIEAAGVTGQVEAIQIFATTIKTGDKRVIIPNASLTSGNIANYSAS